LHRHVAGFELQRAAAAQIAKPELERPAPRLHRDAGCARCVDHRRHGLGHDVLILTGSGDRSRLIRLVLHVRAAGGQSPRAIALDLIVAEEAPGDQLHDPALAQRQAARVVGLAILPFAELDADRRSRSRRRTGRSLDGSLGQQVRKQSEHSRGGQEQDHTLHGN